MPAVLRPQVLSRLLREALREVLRRRYSLYLTIEGWIMVSAMMLIGLAALNTAAPLLYLMFSMLCAFFVLSAVFATNTIRRVRVRRSVPHVWLAGEPMKGVLYVENRKRLTSSYSLRIQDMLEHRYVVGAAFFDKVPPGRKEVSQQYEALFLQRGLYRLQGVELATRFPFGLIERRLFFYDHAEVLVLPQTIPIGEAMAAARVELGEYEANVKGRGTGLYGLRTYTPDLPARDIHWKVSARRGTLMVREYESEEKRRACVIVDNRSAVPEDPQARENFERAIILAASAVKWLCDHGHEVELRTASGMIGFGTGKTHLTRCRRALASLQLLGLEEGESSFLHNPEPGIVRFPVTMGGGKPAQDGSVPLPVDHYRRALDRVFSVPDVGERTHVLPRMF